MTVKIDGVEPNIFPDVDDLDARDAGRHVEVFLDVRIEGKHTPVTVKLSYEQASDVAILLEPFRKPKFPNSRFRSCDFRLSIHSLTWNTAMQIATKTSKNTILPLATAAPSPVHPARLYSLHDFARQPKH